VTSKRAATATIFLAAASLVGCQAVFGLGDYVEGAGGAGAQGSGGATSSSQGGSTSTASDGGAPPGCEFVGAVWSTVELLAAGPASETPPSICPSDGSRPLTLFRGAPSSVPCAACTCTGSGCTAPSFACFTDTNCQNGEQQFNAFTGCFNMGLDARSCRLLENPAVSCVPGGGGTSEAPSFEEFLSFCEAGACETPGYVREDAVCVAVTAEGVPCPEGFPERLELATELSASCPTCSCEGSCGGAPYQATDNFGFCASGGKNISSTTCSVVTTDIGGFSRRYAQRRSEFGASCAPEPAGAQNGVVSVSGEHVVCCRAPLERPGAGGAGGS
jgi:hypothetical protein